MRKAVRMWGYMYTDTAPQFGGSYILHMWWLQYAERQNNTHESFWKMQSKASQLDQQLHVYVYSCTCTMYMYACRLQPQWMMAMQLLAGEWEMACMEFWPDEFDGPYCGQKVVDWVQFQTQCNQTQKENQKITPASRDPHMRNMWSLI